MKTEMEVNFGEGTNGNESDKLSFKMGDSEKEIKQEMFYAESQEDEKKPVASSIHPLGNEEIHTSETVFSNKLETKSENKEVNEDDILELNIKDEIVPENVKPVQDDKKMSDDIEVSDDMADACKTDCEICHKPFPLAHMRYHTLKEHNVQITKYKEIYGNFKITKEVYHKCHLCGKIVLLDSDPLGGHIKGTHKMKEKEYKTQFMTNSSPKVRSDKGKTKRGVKDVQSTQKVIREDLDDDDDEQNASIKTVKTGGKRKLESVEPNGRNNVMKMSNEEHLLPNKKQQSAVSIEASSSTPLESKRKQKSKTSKKIKPAIAKGEIVHVNKDKPAEDLLNTDIIMDECKYVDTSILNSINVSKDTSGVTDNEVKEMSKVTEDVAKHISDVTIDEFKDIADITVDEVNNITETTAKMTKDIKDTTGKMDNDNKNIIEDVIKAIALRNEDINDTTEEVVKDITDSTGAVAKDITDSTGAVAKDTTDTTEEVVKDIPIKIDEVAKVDDSAWISDCENEGFYCNGGPRVKQGWKMCFEAKIIDGLGVMAAKYMSPEGEIYTRGDQGYQIPGLM